VGGIQHGFPVIDPVRAERRETFPHSLPGRSNGRPHPAHLASGDVAVTESKLAVVSDLHLGGGPRAAGWGAGFSDEFTDDQAFSDFLCWLSQGPESRLVFLGDTFDFLRVPVIGTRTGLFARSDAEAVAQLNRIATAHPIVFKTLSAALAAGVQVDFVSGNHDAELIRPAVQDRLCMLLGAHARFHPWLLYIPGLLYAEHGHHHHDVNAFGRPLYPYANGDRRLERPPAAWLGDLRRVSASPRHWWRDAMTGLHGRPSVRTRGEYLAKLLPAHADEIGLSERVLAELHHLASYSPLRIGRRLARTRLQRGEDRDYMLIAAAAVHDLMTRNKLSVPFYAFGHTHAAMLSPLATNASYLNSGTWSTTSWGRTSIRRTWIEITADNRAASARLFHWAGAARPLADRFTREERLEWH
jgi:UDP-2,3-diacylglucosamine pyrophosphatase LpxH